MDESHGIDLLRYLVGEVKEVFAVVDTISNLKITSDDNAFLTLRMKNNFFFTLILIYILDTQDSLRNFRNFGNLIIDRVKNELIF